MSEIDTYEEYEAPQYFDFTNPNEIEGDSFFEAAPDNEVFEISKDTNDPLQEGQDNQQQECQELRRSMSLGDISYLQGAIENNCTGDDDSVSSADTTVNVKEGQLNQLYKYKLSFQKHQYGSERNLTSSYVPMAEAVRKFHASTPDRFHSRAKTEHPVITTTSSQLGPTIPYSPQFISNKRHRPVNILSHEEKELQEFKEAQKHKFKAHPVHKNILLGPAKLPSKIEKKPLTKPEPFNLAQTKPKVITSPVKPKNFQANPAPDFSVKPQLKKPLQKFTQAETPPFLKRYQKKVEKSPTELAPKKALPPKPKTGPLPFSFEVRNEILLRRKEKFIKDFIEAEKKAREFHAQPIPKGVFGSPKIGSIHSTKTAQLRAKTVKLRAKSASEENLRKEIRPRTNIEKKKPLTEIKEFTLNTDLRAKERKAYEEELKAKQEQLEYIKKIKEERRLEEEREEIQRIRKMAEVKAHRIRKYKEVVIAPSNKVTDPISPKFHKSNHLTQDSIKVEDNKENLTA